MLRKVEDADVSGKRVLVRVDFNVPLDTARGEPQIKEDLRIKAAVPTIELLKQKGAAHITLMTHLGRPEGKVDEALRTAPLFKRLGELTNVENVELMENLRFDAREEANDEGFAKELASHGDLFVFDAFAVAHRAAASTTGVTKFLPSYAGLLVEKEVENLMHALAPEHPALAIIGGAKGETKLPLIERFSPLYEKVLVGGALANEYTPTHDNIVMPTDGTPQFKDMLDIGPETQSVWAKEIKAAAFVVWNGPMGMYEKDEYKAGTDALAKALVDATCKAVIGGGDTTAALSKFTFDPGRIFISTGGGAMLEFLANGGSLPAIDVLIQTSKTN